jgi:hypothetical protein
MRIDLCLFLSLLVASCSDGRTNVKNDNKVLRPKEATSGYFYKELNDKELEKMSINAKNGSGEDALILARHYIGKSLSEKKGPDAYADQYFFWLNEGLRMKNRAAAEEVIGYQISIHACNAAKENLSRSAELEIFSLLDLKALELRYRDGCKNF